jgi:hypothetical protein
VIRWALIVGAMALCAGTAGADERTAALVESFRGFCGSELPTLSRIDAKATAEKLPVNIDTRTAAGPEGYFNHTKSWWVSLATGPHELVAGEARGPAGDVASCAITATDPQGEEIKQDLMKAMNIGPPQREAVSPDGMRRSSAWRIQLESENVILLLMDATPTNSPGIVLNLMRRPAAGP